MMIRTVVLLLLGSVISVRGMSQIRFPETGFLSVEDGLSQSTVHCIAFDAEGYAWFGTEDGLNRFDGYTFTTYRSVAGDPSSLSDNFISCLAVGRSGAIWIGTQQGLNTRDHATGTFHAVTTAHDTSALLTKLECTAVLEDHLQTVWIGTSHGLVHYDPGSGSVVALTHDPARRRSLLDDHVLSLLEDSTGTLWVGTKHGVGMYDPGSATFTNYDLPGSQDAYSLCSSTGGKIITGNNRGELFSIDREHGRPVPFPASGSGPQKDIVWDLVVDARGDLWAGTGGHGLWKYLFQEQRWVSYHVYDDFVLSLKEDPSGLMWVGTGKGIHRITRNMELFHWTSCSLPTPGSAGDVWSFYEEEQNTVLVGTNFGIARFDPVQRRLTMLKLIGPSVHALVNDARGVTWAGTFKGLLRWDMKRRQSMWYQHVPNSPVALSDNSVSCLCPDRDGSLWIGTENAGLDRLTAAGDSVQWFLHRDDDPLSLSSDHVTCLLTDSKGTLWIGTANGGVNCREKANSGFRKYRRQSGGNGLSSDRLYSLHEDRKGTVWIGTDAGLNRFDRATGTFTAYHVKDGLPNEVIYGILESANGCLWLSTNRGISCFDPVSLTFRNFTIHDGLQGSEFNAGACLMAANGTLYFGGVNGFNFFDPADLQDNKHPPPVVITGFTVFDRRVRVPTLHAADQAIDLLHSDNFFTVEFAALDYVYPADNQYAYRLDGLDAAWVHPGTRRSASYTNLDPGEYVFRVIGSNSDGVWNTAGASLAIRIVPPFWRRWWFQVSMALLIVSLIVIAIERRFAFLRERTRAQQELSRQIIESQEQERQRIGNSLHDGLGQNLLVIKNLAIMAMDAIRNRKDPERNVDEISTLSSHVLAEVREISYGLRPHHLDQLGLTGAIRAVIARMEAASTVAFTGEIDDVDNLLPASQEIHLFRIVQEGLNNIIRHSRASHAAVRVTRNGPGILITLQDDGVGFDARRPGFGLSGMTERARILGGTIDIRSVQGSGSTIAVAIPLRRNHDA